MKKILFTLFILSSVIANAQAPSWAWEKGVGGNIGVSGQYKGHTFGNSVSTDANGNVFTIGNFQTSAMVIGNYTLTNTNNSGVSSDVFFAKYDAMGNVLWAKSIKGDSSDKGLSIVIDAAYNIYITGSFSSPTITLDTKILTNTSVGSDEIFIAKYNSAGNIIWAKSYGGSSNDFGNAIITDAANNLYITGNFKSQSFTIDTYTLTSDTSSNGDMFIAKFDTSGNALYAMSVGKSCAITFTGTNITSDSNNNIYVTGSCYSSKIIIGNDTIHTHGGQDIFIAKYNSLGNALWAKDAGGPDDDEANSIATDASGNAYITGYFSYDSIKIGNYTLINAAGSGCSSCFTTYIAKYATTGKVIWAKSLGIVNPNGAAFGPCITTDNYNVYVGGGFINVTPWVVFASDTLNNGNPGFDAIFIAKYDSLGTAIWGKTASSISWNQVLAITNDTYGNIYSVGFYESPTFIFGADTLVNKNTNNQTADYFIAKIGTAGVGIEKYNTTDNAIIYPNPSNGNISIASINNIDYIKVTDMLGQIVFETKSFTKIIALQINNAGFYFITTTSGKEVSTKKIIVNK